MKHMELQEYFSEVDRAYSELTPPQMEQRFRELLHAAETEHGGESGICAAMQSELGAFYRGQRRYTESEASFMSALAILAKTVGKASPDYATGLNNLAGTHRLMRKFDQAEAEFAEALALYRATLGTQHVLYASGLNNLSLLCLDRGDLAAAADYLKQSSEVLTALPECQDELAASLCNLATLDRNLGRAAEGAERVQRAIELFEGPLGTATPHYHAALSLLGLCRRDLGELAAARDAFERAASAAKKLYGAQHREYQTIVTYLQCAEKELEDRA